MITIFYNALLHDTPTRPLLIVATYWASFYPPHNASLSTDWSAMSLVPPATLGTPALGKNHSFRPATRRSIGSTAARLQRLGGVLVRRTAISLPGLNSY